MAGVGACSGNGEDDLSANTTETTPTTRTPRATTTTEAETTDTPNTRATSTTTTAARATTTTAGTTTTTAPTVLAEATANLPASPLDSTLLPIRIRLTALTRLPGDVVEARLTVVNESSEEFALWAAVSDHYDLRDVALVDLQHDRRYLALLDSEDTCLCTELNVSPGESFQGYVQFAAPPPEVTSADVTVPGFPPLNGIPIR